MIKQKTKNRDYSSQTKQITTKFTSKK